MAWDPVPWAVDGGEISGQVMRLVSYLAAQRGEGVLQATDLEVRALAQAGPAVQIMPGACSILTRTAGYTDDLYVARHPTGEEQYAVAATGSSGPRSDLVVAVIKDPETTSWELPSGADPLVGPYVDGLVIPDVDPGTTDVPSVGLGYSAIPLARIDMPVSTAAVQQSYIKDLRKLAAPRTWPETNAHAIVAGDVPSGGAKLTSQDQTNGAYWPPSVGRWFVPVPIWATRARIIATLTGVLQPPGNVQGGLWVQVGVDGGAGTFKTQTVAYDTMGLTQNARQTYVIADDVPIPAAFRGTSTSFGIRGNLSPSSNTANAIVADTWTAIALQILFVEIPESSFQT